MPKEIKTDRAPSPRGFYSQGVQAGPFLYIAGQGPLDTTRHVVGYNACQQARQALRNIQAVVEAAGGTISDLVQITVYVSDIDYWSEVNTAFGEFFADVEVKPTRAVLPIKDMINGSKVVMQAVAYLGESK